MFKVLCLFTISLSIASATVYPTAIFHGMGDACRNAGMKQITEKIGKWMGAHTECIDSAAGAASLLDNFETQSEKACEMLKANKNFQNTKFNVMGLSQGGLIARYIVEKCDTDMPVQNMLTAGGPHMGVDKVPQCFNGFFCDIVNSVSEEIVYFKIVQDHFGPAGYFRDVSRYSEYLQDSVFLPALNGEIKENMDNAKARFIKLNGMMLVMFSEDTMIHPKETAQFGSLDKDGKPVTMENQAVYTSDVFGLKTLNEAGKIKLHTCDGNHLQFTMSDVENVFVPFLKSDSTTEQKDFLADF